MSNTRGFFYQLARALGDVNAIRRGPAATGKRIVRKAVYRNVNKTTARLMRRIGL